MAILVRHYQRIRPENWDKVLEIAKRWVPIGRRLGIPPDRFCRYISGPDSHFTLVNEREYDSAAAWEAAAAKMVDDPENQALGRESMPLVEDWRIETLLTIDLE